MSKNNGIDRMKQSQEDTRQMLATWRKNRVHEVTLPSGLDVLLKDVTMTDLLLTGKLPESMMEMAQSAAEQGKKDIDLKALAKNGHDLKILIDELTMICVVEPKIAGIPDDEHIGLDELSGEDKMFIFNWVNREVEQVRSFREGESKPLATV
jgi:hypothetical protein